MFRSIRILCLLALLCALEVSAQPIGRWVEQPVEGNPRSLMGISMADTGRGYAVGDVNVLLGLTGVYVKRAGDPLWRMVPASAFSPPLTIALSSWAQDVHAVPNTGIAYISWRDDYRSLVYKTLNYGNTWFNVSPINPILYGIRYAVTFKDMSEGIIVGEGPGRVHRTVDGGQNWTSYTIPVSEPLTDAKHSGFYWNVSGGGNTFYRFNPISNRWLDFSIPLSPEFFPTHLKMSWVDDDRGFISGFNQNGPNHILKTTNGGMTWESVPTQPPFARAPSGHKGIWFFDSTKGWAASLYNEFAYTSNGGYSWDVYAPQIIGGKTYAPLNKLVFLNEAAGWAVGGNQRDIGYPSVSDGWIFKWEGTQRPDISTTTRDARFDTLACDDYVDLDIPVYNSGTGTLKIATGDARLNHADFSIVQTSFPINIPPGESRLIRVRWQPPVNHFGATPPGATLTILSNDDAHTPWVIALSGMHRVSRPDIPSTAQFPPVCVGDTSECRVVVHTYGNLAPTIFAISMGADNGTIELLNKVVGDTLKMTDTLSLRYWGTKPGAFGAALVLKVGDRLCPADRTISFNGFQHSNHLKPSPSILTFGDVCVGTSETLYLTLENEGTQPGSIEKVMMVSGDSVFTFKPDTSAVIKNGSTRQFAVRFEPRRVDSAEVNTVYRVVTGPCLDTTEVLFRGRGVATMLDVQPDSLLRIGPLPLGKTVTTSVRIRNRGSQQAHLLDMSFVPAVAGLSASFPTLPYDMNAQELLPITVTCTALTADSIRTTLRVISESPCPDTTVLLVDIVSDALPMIDVATSLVFPTQTCSDPILDSVLVRNPGQLPLDISALELGGSDPSHFKVLRPQPPFQIPPGQSRFVVLSYAGPSNGASSAVLRIKHNDASESNESVVVLNARRKTQTVRIEGDTLTPMLGCVGEIVTRRLVLSNPNSDPIQLLRLELLEGAPFAAMSHPSIPRSIPAGGEADLELRFEIQPDTMMAIVFRITTDPCHEVRVVTMHAGPWDPALDITPSPLQLGTRSVFDTTRIPLSVRNADSIDVLVDTVIVRGMQGAVNVTHAVRYPFVLRPDSLLSAQLALRIPKDTGAVVGGICVVLSQPCRDTICVDASGRFTAGALLAEPSSVRMVFAACDTVRCDSVLVRNPLSIAQRVRASILPADVFTLAAGDEEFDVAPGKAVMVHFCARLDARVSAAGLLTLDAGEGFAQVQVMAVRDTARLRITDTLDAGNLPWCEKVRDVSLPLVNAGELPYTVLSAQLPTGAWTLTSSLPLNISAGGSEALRLRFTPSAKGEANPVVLRLRIVTQGCVEDVDVVLRGRHATPYLEVTPSTLLYAGVTVGSKQTRSLIVRNRDLAGLRLRELRSSLPQCAAEGSFPLAIDSAGSVSIPVAFTPTAAGTLFGTLCLIFDAPCADTLCVDIEANAIEGILKLDQAELRFGTLLQCEDDTLTAVLTNQGTSDVTLLSTSITGPGMGAYTLLDPVAGNETLAAGAQRSFRIRFAPSAEADGSVTASLFISTNLPQQNMVEVPLYGRRATQQPAARHTIILGQVVLGAVINRSVTLLNAGSGELRYTTVQAPAGWGVENPLPIVLPAAAQGDVELRIQPMTAGSFSDTIRLYNQPCGGFTEIVVTGIALQRFTVSPLDLGALAFCRNADGLVVLRNNSGAEVRVDSLNIVGAHAGRFSIPGAPALPTPLGAGQDLVLTVRCVPQAGDRGPIGALLRVRALVDGSDLVFTAPLSADIDAAVLDAPSDVDLGPSPIGVSTAPMQLSLVNNAAWPVRFERVSVSSARLDVQAPPAGVVPPGGDLTLTVGMQPDGPGEQVDTLLLYYSEPCVTTDTVLFRCTGTGDVVDLRFSVNELVGAPDDTVDIVISVDRDLSRFARGDWTATLSFNPSMLYPLDYKVQGTLSSGMQLDAQYDQLRGIVSLSSTGAPVTGNAVVIVRCLVLVGDAVETPLHLENAHLLHPVFRTVEQRAGRFTLDGYCLDEGNRLVRARAGFWLSQVAPQPAGSQASVTFGIGEDGPVSLRLYDANGREAAVLLDASLVAGTHARSLPLHTLPNGYYRLVLGWRGQFLSRGLHVLR